MAIDTNYWKNWLNPFKKKWWHKEEWKKRGGGLAVEILEENGDGCSHTRNIHSYSTFRHKSSCKTRKRYEGLFLGSWREEEVVFDDPITVNGVERKKLEEIEFTDPYVDYQAEEG